MKLTFYSLSSGSSGNCYYLGNENQGLLIDAGISATAIRKYLQEIGISMDSLMGVIVTHNHGDHVRGLEVLVRKHQLPVLTTAKVWNSLTSPGSKLANHSFREIELEKEFKLAGFEIKAFPVSHDAPETIGFHINGGEEKITIATDLGYICTYAAKYIRAASILVIESNYDEKMLTNGNYPHFLKTRIQSDHGHLGNQQVSNFLADTINSNLHTICFAHLSINNNSPEIALNTVIDTFSARGVELGNSKRISILNRNSPTKIFAHSI